MKVEDLLFEIVTRTNGNDEIIYRGNEFRTFILKLDGCYHKTISVIHTNVVFNTQMNALIFNVIFDVI